MTDIVQEALKEMGLPDAIFVSFNLAAIIGMKDTEHIETAMDTIINSGSAEYVTEVIIALASLYLTALERIYLGDDYTLDMFVKEARLMKERLSSV